MCLPSFNLQPLALVLPLRATQKNWPCWMNAAACPSGGAARHGWAPAMGVSMVTGGGGVSPVCPRYFVEECCQPLLPCKSRTKEQAPTTAPRAPRMNHGVSNHPSKVPSARNHWRSITHLQLFLEPSPVVLKCRPQSRMPQQQRIQRTVVAGHLPQVSAYKHTSCVVKTETSINISALYLKQQWIIFIFYSSNEILYIPSVIKEDAKEKLFK